MCVGMCVCVYVFVLLCIGVGTGHRAPIVGMDIARSPEMESQLVTIDSSGRICLWSLSDLFCPRVLFLHFEVGLISPGARFLPVQRSSERVPTLCPSLLPN